MTEMNPPPLGIKLIREVEELKRVFAVYLKHETDGSSMWNEYVWSYAVDFYKIYHDHYSKFPDFSDRATDTARHNAVTCAVDVMTKQVYNFNSIRAPYAQKIFEVVSDHINREEAKKKLQSLSTEIVHPSAYKNPTTLIVPVKKVAEQLTALKKESGLTYQQLADGIKTDITTVQRHLAGKLRPRADKIILYEKTLGERLGRPVKISTPS